MWSIPPPSLKILCLFVLDLCVVMSAIHHHWEFVCSHCACAVSRDLCVRGKFPHIFEICDPDLSIYFCNFCGSTIKKNPVIYQKSVLLCVTGHRADWRCRHQEHQYIVMATGYSNSCQPYGSVVNCVQRTVNSVNGVWMINNFLHAKR